MYMLSTRYALIIELLATYGLVNLFTSNNGSKLFTSKSFVSVILFDMKMVDIQRIAINFLIIK